MKRIDFLKNTAFAAFSMSIFSNVSKNDNGNFHGDCETSNDILGPFYIENAPSRYDLTWEGLKGTIIEVRGKVYTDNCETPLEKALVEIWHCDTEGEYDNTAKTLKHRAKWVTNENGDYAFKTIIPGKYLNGKLYRPSHIHFRVRAKEHKALVSQIYFAGDPHIEEDPWASKPKAQHRILPFIPEDVNGNLVVNFDIHLRKQ